MDNRNMDNGDSFNINEENPFNIKNSNRMEIEEPIIQNSEYPNPNFFDDKNLDPFGQNRLQQPLPLRDSISGPQAIEEIQVKGNTDIDLDQKMALFEEQTNFNQSNPPKEDLKLD